MAEDPSDIIFIMSLQSSTRQINSRLGSWQLAVGSWQLTEAGIFSGLDHNRLLLCSLYARKSLSLLFRSYGPPTLLIDSPTSRVDHPHSYSIALDAWDSAQTSTSSEATAKTIFCLYGDDHKTSSRYRVLGRFTIVVQRAHDRRQTTPMNL